MVFLCYGIHSRLRNARTTMLPEKWWVQPSIPANSQHWWVFHSNDLGKLEVSSCYLELPLIIYYFRIITFYYLLFQKFIATILEPHYLFHSE